MGMVDDVKPMVAGWKLIMQIAVACIAFAGGYSIQALSVPLVGPVVLGAFSFPVTLFWFLGCMNAVNLLDGLDGLAAGVCVFVSVTLLLMSLFLGNSVSMLLTAGLTGALVGFLLFNFHPATIFLGDSGTMLLGYLIASLALQGATRKAEASVALLIPIIALGLPIFDTAAAILRRWAARAPVSVADRGHIHHVLLSRGLSHRGAVLALYVASILLCGAAVLVMAGRDELTVMVLGSLAILAFVSVRVLGGVRFAQVLGRVSEDWARSRRSRGAAAAAVKTTQGIRNAQDIHELWQSCGEALAAMGLDSAMLHLYQNEGLAARELTWYNTGSTDPSALSGKDIWEGRLPIRRADRVIGELHVRRARDDGPPVASATELIHRLRDELSVQLERLDSHPPTTAK
jgi:UDP-N-acetylmuramyl pentapeptide phosphotransferase/UDP-N-acetylglucosamine-1-phosphate transferase